jgi:acyl-coenzyme A synthetase/AMP-(fatty) acid ligase
VCYRAASARRFVALAAADRCLNLLPCFHGSAILISIIGSLFAGASVDCRDLSAAMDFQRTVDEINATWCALPPPFLRTLLDLSRSRHGDSARPSLRVLFSTGAPISAGIAEAVEQTFGIPLQVSYGAQECGGVAVDPLPPRPRKFGSAGISFGPDVIVLDESGRAVLSGQGGEIAVRGPVCLPDMTMPVATVRRCSQETGIAQAIEATWTRRAIFS